MTSNLKDAAYLCRHKTYFYVDIQLITICSHARYLWRHATYVNMQSLSVNIQHTYVDLRNEYVDMQLLYVNMQFIYVNRYAKGLQVKNISHFYIDMLHIIPL